MAAPWDAGLQPERTELAWRRTVLAVTAGTTIAARYLGASQPVLGLVLPAVALLGGLALLRFATLRARRIDRALRTATESENPAMPGAALLGVVAALCLAATLVATGYIVSAAVR